MVVLHHRGQARLGCPKVGRAVHSHRQLLHMVGSVEQALPGDDTGVVDEDGGAPRGRFGGVHRGVGGQAVGKIDLDGVDLCALCRHGLHVLLGGGEHLGVLVQQHHVSAKTGQLLSHELSDATGASRQIDDLARDILPEETREEEGEDRACCCDGQASGNEEEQVEHGQGGGDHCEEEKDGGRDNRGRVGRQVRDGRREGVEHGL
mmetsp:Transcript_24927/g.80539  ORF Transcript_24927/g.80539 Transcript_24927/m.80539 type:complete len:205 (+) Transcript_24927:1273-1887(+)